MDRINHIKLVTPDPEAVERFLTEVLDIPAGWMLGTSPGSTHVLPESPAVPPAETPLTMDGVAAFRGDTTDDARIAGSTESRQFQIFAAERPHIWAVAIGTRHLERAYDRCHAAGIRCTEPDLTAWGDGAVRFFFAEVGGILFEVMRSE